MKKIIPVLILTSAAALNAQSHQWNFDETNGTVLSSTVDSISGTLDFSAQANGTASTTNGSGLLVGGFGLGHAVVGLTTGTYQFDLTGVTVNYNAGNSFNDDWGGFGLRSFAFTNQLTFDSADSNDAALLVFGNNDNTGGLDIRVLNNNAQHTLLSNVTADFSGTYDFRVVMDLDNDLASFYYQVDGGGYTTIAENLANANAANSLYLGMNSDTWNGEFMNFDQVTVTAVPEPWLANHL